MEPYSTSRLNGALSRLESVIADSKSELGLDSLTGLTEHRTGPQPALWEGEAMRPVMRLTSLVEACREVVGVEDSRYYADSPALPGEADLAQELDSLRAELVSSGDFTAIQWCLEDVRPALLAWLRSRPFYCEYGQPPRSDGAQEFEYEVPRTRKETFAWAVGLVLSCAEAWHPPPGDYHD